MAQAKPERMYPSRSMVCLPTLYLCMHANAVNRLHSHMGYRILISWCHIIISYTRYQRRVVSRPEWTHK
jgi:hypothetical protein